MDPLRIKALLHDTPPRQLKTRIGEEVRIDLPKIPLTADTEFLELVAECDSGGCQIRPETSPDEGEGLLATGKIVATANETGKYTIRVFAVDALSHQKISGVEPLEFVVEADNH